jgi:hypothetical protein
MKVRYSFRKMLFAGNRSVLIRLCPLPTRRNWAVIIVNGIRTYSILRIEKSAKN